jgi:hypothetical protein
MFFVLFTLNAILYVASFLFFSVHRSLPGVICLIAAILFTFYLGIYCIWRSEEEGRYRNNCFLDALLCLDCLNCVEPVFDLSECLSHECGCGLPDCDC